MAASLLFGVGCSKLTAENYDKVKVGMPYDEVVGLLGKADDCSSAIGMKSCTWGDNETQINVQFAGKTDLLFSNKGL